MRAGLTLAPSDQSGDAPRASLTKTPQYIAQALSSDPAAWSYFEKLVPSYRRLYIGWIDSAKQEQTKARRLRGAIGLLAAGKKLGLR